MSKSKKTTPRVPPKVNDIQVNHCKNPRCINFGVPAKSEAQPLGPGAAKRGADKYTRSGDSKGTVRLVCRKCRNNTPMKSNLAISEEVERFMDVFENEAESGCLTEGCPNANTPPPGDYSTWGNHGWTSAKSRRYLCKLCGKTTSKKTAISGQRKSHINLSVLKSLVNKVPIRGIARILDISTNTVYQKIDFLEKQCRAFVTHRERGMLENKRLPKLYISVDRQEYMVNWPSCTDRRNIILRAVASVENRTGYVFGMHADFDPRMVPLEVNQDAILSGDLHEKNPFRKYARVWLWSEFESRGPLRDFYEDLTNIEFEDLFSIDPKSVNEDYGETWLDLPKEVAQLPNNGMMIHTEYTLYGHFFYLKRLLKNAPKVRFFMDQEPAIREACLTAFADEILDYRCDGFFVRFKKSTTQPEKEAAVAMGQRFLNDLAKADPYEMSDKELKLHFLENELPAIRAEKNWTKRWLWNPFHTINEPYKSVNHLTDLGHLENRHLSHLYLMASLHGVDSWFNKVRRRISMLERPIKTSSQYLTWYGYSSYNPAMVIKALNIFRVVHNFCEVGKDGKTPAMRLGLAKGPVALEKLIYFKK